MLAAHLLRARPSCRKSAGKFSFTTRVSFPRTAERKGYCINLDCYSLRRNSLFLLLTKIENRIQSWEIACDWFGIASCVRLEADVIVWEYWNCKDCPVYCLSQVRRCPHADISTAAARHAKSVATCPPRFSKEYVEPQNKLFNETFSASFYIL